jgi:hypothetical protein
MAVIAQLSNSTDNLTEITSRILALRNERSQSANKKAYDNAQRQKAAEEHDYQAGTFNDYADTNFRYLKASNSKSQSRVRPIPLALNQTLSPAPLI